MAIGQQKLLLHVIGPGSREGGGGRLSAPGPTEQGRAGRNFQFKHRPHHLGRQPSQVQLRRVLRRRGRGFLAIAPPGVGGGGGLGGIALVGEAIFFFVVAASSSSSGGRVGSGRGGTSRAGRACAPGVGGEGAGY